MVVTFPPGFPPGFLDLDLVSQGSLCSCKSGSKIGWKIGSFAKIGSKIGWYENRVQNRVVPPDFPPDFGPSFFKPSFQGSDPPDFRPDFALKPRSLFLWAHSHILRVGSLNPTRICPGFATKPPKYPILAHSLVECIRVQTQTPDFFARREFRALRVGRATKRSGDG